MRHTDHPSSEALFGCTGAQLVALRDHDAPAVLRAQAACWQQVFGPGACDGLLTDGAVAADLIRVVRDGEPYPRSVWVAPETPWGERPVRDLTRPERLVLALRMGATVVLDGADRRHHGLRRACARIEQALLAPAHATVFVAGPRARGFPIHYDRSDAFAVQLTGRKRWQVFSPVLRKPLRDEPCPEGGIDPATIGSPAIDRTLVPGDVLFIPRGWPYRALGQDEGSTHVTFASRPFTAADVVRAARPDATPDLEKHPTLRGALPPTWWPDATDVAWIARLTRIRPDDLRDAWNDALDAFVLGTPPDVGAWLRSWREPLGLQLQADTVLTAQPHLVRVHHGAEGVRVVAPGRTLAFPVDAGEALVYALDSSVRPESFTPSALPGLPDSGYAVALCRHLADENLVSPPV